MIDTNKLLSENSIVDIVSRHVDLKREGSEHKGICPFHEDDKPSLMVNEKKGIYKCFACDAGGDSINFLMRLKGVSFREACESISNGSDHYEINTDVRPKKIQKPREWKHIVPAPNELSSVNHYKYGETKSIWAYRDFNGGVVGYACRFDLGDGKKDVLPYIYAEKDGKREWRWLGFEKPRSLYNSDLLHQNPKAVVVIVEGEKTADAVQNQLDPTKNVCTTWIGGANGIRNADFKSLHGRKIIYWPDNDTEQKYGSKHEKAGEIKPWYEQPGNKAMLEIFEMIGSKCSINKWVKVPQEYPHKWDAADKYWESGELRDFVRLNITDMPTVSVEEPKKEVKQQPANNEVVKVTPDKIIQPPKPPKIQSKGDPRKENPYFKCLGYDKDEKSNSVYYFFSYMLGFVMKLTTSSMTKQNIVQLAPINWWEDNFPGGRGGVSMDASTKFLFDMSRNTGLFKEKMIRGRGAWVDEGRFVIHTGDELIVDMKPIPLKSIESRYVYELGEKMGLGGEESLSNTKAAQLIEKIKWLRWEREINAYMMAGWCVIAPFCGVLNWRPHIWVTGPAGSGKSWTMDNIIKRLLGEAAVVVQGKTTEPGIRGLLQNDARAVLFDESDVDSHNDKERIQSILALARSSSYHDGGVVGKGTQTGGSRTFTMRSCFAFSSIAVQLNQQSDRSRFTMLGLMSFEGHRTKEDFLKFEHDWMSTINDDFVQQMQARTIRLLPIILKNSRTFADAVSHVIGQRRIGDQVGGMLAGAYSLVSVKEISFDDAITWVKERDWSEEKGLELTKDEYQLFSKIMGHTMKVEAEYKIVERSVGELILLAANKDSELGLTPETASKRLKRSGIMVSSDGNMIYLANTADAIKSIIRNTPWSNNHNKILERLPGAQKISSRTYYPGCNSRGVAVPMGMITDGLESKADIPNSFREVPDDEMPF